MYDVEKIGKLIGEKIKEKRQSQKRKISQSELGEKVGVTGKQISNYESGKPIPPMDVLFKLCNVFNCELGYLLGEEAYSAGTQLDTAIENKTGLKNETINTIIKITGTESECLDWGHQAEEYRKILNKFLTSENFLDIIKLMLELDYIYNQNQDTEMQKLSKEWSEERHKRTINNYRLDYINLNLTKEEYKDIEKFEKAIDKDRSKKEYFKREIAFKRLELQESFTFLLNELYPKKDRD